MTTPATQTACAFSETVEAQGHLIDSHTMERIFDTVVEFGGRFEVEHVSIGRTNSDPSRLRLRIESANADDLEKMLTQFWVWGARLSIPARRSCGRRRRDCCAPEDFYSTTNQRTQVRVGGTVDRGENQRMDAMVVVGNETAVCRGYVT